MPNGYFQLLNNEAGAYLRVVKAAGTGEEVKINEVMEYLNMTGVSYDLSTLNQGLGMLRQSPGEEMFIPLNPQPSRPVAETCRFIVSPDRMQVTVRFYAPSADGLRMSVNEFLRDLNYQKITYGIKNQEIENFFIAPRYCTDFVVAEGTPPRQGTDARVEYFFNTDLRIRPTLKEDGTVDFFNLNNISHCNKGQLLARLHPGDPGESGFTVYHEPVKPAEVKKAVLMPTNNVTLSEDKLELYAGEDGHVTLVEGKIFVSNVYTVDNVNNATGNIDFEGSVVVLGNVFSNFTVKARGNIEVRGIVEGALLESGADIIIARGMKGMGKGILKAAGNVLAKFLENAKVEAGGYVSTDSVLHSEVIAGTEINVTSKKGFIIGGRVCAGKLVQVKTLGSEMGSDTVIEVGVDSTLKQRIQRLQKKITDLTREIKAAQPILNSMAQKIAQGVRLQPDQVKYVQSLTVENKQRTQELEASMDELDELQRTFERSSGAQVVVSGEVHRGTLICIGDVSLTVRSSLSYCRFVKQEGEVKMVGM